VDHGWLSQGSTSSADVRQSYDGWAGTYNDDLDAWDYRAPAKAAELLRDAVAPSSSLLDAGCGTGLVGQALRDAGFSGALDGIDLSPPSLEEARALGIYRDLRAANLQELPLSTGDNAYDAVICVGVLTYVPDSEAVLREFARLVRPGGVVLATQRDDLYRARAFDLTIQGLVDAAVFSEADIAAPEPYLPNNPDFGSVIKVIHAVLSVA